MFLYLKSIFNRTPDKNTQTKKNPSSYLFLFFLTVLEDVLFWKKWWLSLIFYICFSIIFMVCAYRQLNLLQIFVGLTMVSISVDALEVWLIYKHRTTCLKRLTAQDFGKLPSIATSIYNWIEKKTIDFLYLRNRNHTKAFLLLQIIFSVILIVGKYINGYILTYCFCTFIIFFAKIVPQFMKIIRKVQLNAESDLELEGLIPEDSDANLDLLTIEPERKAIFDDRQSLDYWKPDDIPLEEVSDSSDTSSSLVTNLSIEKMHTLSKDVEVTDSSEDEYMPLAAAQPPEQPRSSLELRPAGSWGAAYGMFSSIGGAVASMLYTAKEDKRRKRVSSVDSSDGFEIINENDVI